MLNSAKLFILNEFVDDRGNLLVLDQESFPFTPVRIFMTSVNAAQAVRGRHAHKVCSQLMLSIGGAIEVTCHDNFGQSTFILDSPKKALFIPPKVWAIQRFLSIDATLVVLASHQFDAEDYIFEIDNI